MKRTSTAASATLLLMASSLVSGVLGLVRIKYVNFLFGAGPAQDAYRAAFTLPDLVNYFLIGGAASISVVTILNRHLHSNSDTPEADADRALSVILTNMVLVLGTGILFAELFAPALVHLANPGFDPHRAALCTQLTRIILPGQLFFFIGAVFSSRLQVRKIFLYQACTPLLYNAGILAGAFLLHRSLGIHALAVGVLFGVITGSALLNGLGAFRNGLRFSPIFQLTHPDFIDWLRLSLPLMIGVSLVMFDAIYLRYFASTITGGITLVANAKDLFNAPFNVIGPAAGAASLPFFAALFEQKKEYDFSASVASAASRLIAFGTLVAAWMVACAPWLMDLLRGGRFSHADAASTTGLFRILAVTLGLWAAQGIYARAFYAASDTLTPAITGTVITVVSAPVYMLLFRLHGLTGLVIASDLGILTQTAALAVLLHKRRLVSLAHTQLPEILRCFIAAIAVGTTVTYAARWLPPPTTHLHDTLTLTAATALWALLTFGLLTLLGSALPSQLLHRLRRT